MMDDFSENSFVQHQKYGVGRISIVEERELLIEFSDGKEVVFSKEEIESALIQSELKKLIDESFYVISNFYKDKLSEILKTKPVEVVEMIFKDGISLIRKSELHNILVNKYISEEQWEGWWKSLIRQIKDFPKFRIKDKETISIREDINKDLIARLSSAYSFESKKEIFREFIELSKKNYDLQSAKDEIKGSLNLILESHLEPISKRFEGASIMKQIDELGKPQESTEITEYIEKAFPHFLQEILKVDEVEAAKEILLIKGAKERILLLEIFKEKDKDKYLKVLSVLMRTSRDLRDFSLQELISLDEFNKISSDFSEITNAYKIDADSFSWMCKSIFNRKIDFNKLELDWAKLFISLFNVLSEVEVVYDIFKGAEYEHSGLKKRKEKEILNYLSNIDFLQDLIKKNDIRFSRQVVLLYKETSSIEETIKEKIYDFVKSLHPELEMGERESFIWGEKSSIDEETYKRLKKEYDEIVKAKIPTNIEEIKRARKWGDIAENAEFHAAKEKQAELEGRKRQLENVLSSYKNFTRD